VAALLNLPQCCSYEAQAASALEGLALEALLTPRPEPWPLALPLQQSDPGEPLQWNWHPLLQQLLEGLRHGVARSALALAFHQALAQAIGDLAAQQGSQQLLLAGGCFQNGLLLELTLEALSHQGCRGYWPQRLPCNDGALPIGQLLARSSLPITG
jgi:hydrogenase maturation protein HypF